MKKEEKKAITESKKSSRIRIKKRGRVISKVPINLSYSYFFKGIVENRLRISELSFSDIAPMIEFFEYKQQDLAQFLDVNPSTISRWKNKDSDIGSLQSKNVLDVDEIIAKGVRIFGSELQFKEWLNTSNYALGDIKPIELLKNPYGVEMVEEAINGLSWGTYI
jgi:putative toxin-antitoxin system antitoxin component (TIGR02293 family)